MLQDRLGYLINPIRTNIQWISINPMLTDMWYIFDQSFTKWGLLAIVYTLFRST